MRCLLNHAREKRGVDALRRNRRLDRAAVLKLRDNVRCDEFSHTACGKPFISVFRRARYVTAETRSYSVGENLAWGQGRLGTPRRIVLAWLRSDGHRRNLFSRGGETSALPIARCRGSRATSGSSSGPTVSAAAVSSPPKSAKIAEPIGMSATGAKTTVYDRLGARPVVNCRGIYSELGEPSSVRPSGRPWPRRTALRPR